MGQSTSRNTLPSLADTHRYDTLEAKCHRFRILIIGRANSGKTTILQRTCNTTGNPVVYNSQGQKMDPTILKSSASRGIHDIEDQMIFKSNPGFCFHDSRGFEAGGIEELEKVKAFIDSRSKERMLSDQLHAIWYCIPVDDSRPFTAAENWFFSECGTGNVPVIVIFTKFDALDNKAFGALIAKGESLEEAIRFAPDHAVNEFKNSHLQKLYDQPYPPKSHVYLRDMNQKEADCSRLIEKTAAALDNEALQQLFVSTQRNSLELCMEYAVNEPVIREAKKQRSLVATEFKDVIGRIVSWFPQYNGYLYEADYLRYRADGDHPDRGADIIWSQLSPLFAPDSPIQTLVHVAIITLILAEFEYLLWNAGHENTLQMAISVYFKRADQAAIAESANKATESFETSGSYDELSQEMLEIAVKNRLSQELLQDPILMENRPS